MQKESQEHSANESFKAHLHINLSVLPPLLSREQFSAYTGASLDTVRGWAQTHTIPTVKVGRQRLINVARLVKDLKAGKTDFRQGDYPDGV